MTKRDFYIYSLLRECVKNSSAGYDKFTGLETLHYLYNMGIIKEPDQTISKMRDKLDTVLSSMTPDDLKAWLNDYYQRVNNERNS
jgi:hypothetical protein